MGNRVRVTLSEVRDSCSGKGGDLGEPYWELTVSDDEEENTTWLGKEGDPSLAEVRERLVNDQLGLIVEYGTQGLYEFACDMGAYILDDWTAPEDLTTKEGD